MRSNAIKKLNDWTLVIYLLSPHAHIFDLLFLYITTTISISPYNFPVSPTSSHHAPKSIIPNDYHQSTDYNNHNNRDRYRDVTNNPHLQWQRQPIENNYNNNNYGYRDPVPYVTKTIAGFMDFVTTVDNTVMVFTPQGLPSKTGKKKN